MLTTFERIIAWRYLRAKRSESFVAVIILFSLIGITLGVATLIVVLSVMNGVREEMLRHFVGLSGHVQVIGNGRPIENYQQLVNQLRQVSQVSSVMPLVEGQVMITAHGQARGVQVRAMPELPAYIKSRIVAGKPEVVESGEGVLLGERLARALRVMPGERVTFISPDGRQTVLGLVPRMKAYTVSGIFKFGMNSIDANLIIMPFAPAQIFFKLADNGQDMANAIEVKVSDLDKAGIVAAEIRSQITDSLGYGVYDWRQTNAAVFEALNVQRVVMFLILMLIIIVAAFNIISSLVMLVKDKQRDIAVLRAMGATRGMIQRIFMLSGLAVGAGGTVLGMALGLVLALNLDDIRLWIEAKTGQHLLGEQLYFLASLPAKVDIVEVTGVTFMSLLLSLLATLYPSRRAASLNPAEALRYE